MCSITTRISRSRCWRLAVGGRSSGSPLGSSMASGISAGFQLGRTMEACDSSLAVDFCIHQKDGTLMMRLFHFLKLTARKLYVELLLKVLTWLGKNAIQVRL